MAPVSRRSVLHGLLATSAGGAAASALSGCGALTGFATTGGSGMTFFSTRFAPVEEAERFRHVAREPLAAGAAVIGWYHVASMVDAPQSEPDQVEALSLGVRAESVLGAGEPADPVLTCTVEVYEPLGSSVPLTTVLSGHRVEVSAPPGLRPAPGDSPRVAPTRTRWYDPETQPLLEVR